MDDFGAGYYSANHNLSSVNQCYFLSVQLKPISKFISFLYSSAIPIFISYILIHFNQNNVPMKDYFMHIMFN